MNFCKSKIVLLVCAGRYLFPPFLRMTPLPGAALPPVPPPSGGTLWQRSLWGYIFLRSRRLRPTLIFFEAQARREQVKAFQFFDMADHRSLVHAELAGYGGIGRRTVMGFLTQMPLDNQVDRKPIHAYARQILVDNPVLNVDAGWGVCRGALVHIKTLSRGQML